MLYKIKDIKSDKILSVPEKPISGKHKIILNEDMSISVNEYEMKIFERNTLICTYQLVNGQVLDEPVFPDLFNEWVKNDEERTQNSLSVIKNIRKLIICFLNIVNDENIKKKIIYSNGYEKVKVSSYNLEYKVYKQTVKGYDITKENNITTVNDNYNGETYCFPSANFPLLSENYLILDHTNTDNFNDEGELALLLSEVRDMPGYCHQNSQRIYDILKKSFYSKEHKIEYKSGWLVMIKPVNNIIYHSFILVDGKHIIDLNNVSIKVLNEGIKTSLKGTKNLSITEIVKEERKIVESNKSFMDRYGYGKAMEGIVYICNDSNKNLAEETVRNLIKKNPYNPAFRGMKLGNNGEVTNAYTNKRQ